MKTESTTEQYFPQLTNETLKSRDFRVKIVLTHKKESYSTTRPSLTSEAAKLKEEKDGRPLNYESDFRNSFGRSIGAVIPPPGGASLSYSRSRRLCLAPARITELYRRVIHRRPHGRSNLVLGAADSSHGPPRYSPGGRLRGGCFIMAW